MSGDPGHKRFCLFTRPADIFGGWRGSLFVARKGGGGVGGVWLCRNKNLHDPLQGKIPPEFSDLLSPLAIL